MVIFIGVLGGIFGNLIFSLLNIRNAQAKGVAIGTACHAIGTASLITEEAKAGAFASVAMALSALLRYNSALTLSCFTTCSGIVRASSNLVRKTHDRF